MDSHLPAGADTSLENILHTIQSPIQAKSATRPVQRVYRNLLILFIQAVRTAEGWLLSTPFRHMLELSKRRAMPGPELSRIINSQAAGDL